MRGNGKIIQELEAISRGAGWNVVKVIWGSYWDALLARDVHGHLRQRMMECVDGDYQTFQAQATAPTCANISSTRRNSEAMIANWTEEDVWRLNRGGHDPHKVARPPCRGEPPGPAHGDLAKTIKGYGMGESGEAQNITHQQKKMGTTSLKAFRDRFKLPSAMTTWKGAYLRTSPRLAGTEYMRERSEVSAATCRRPFAAKASAAPCPASAFDAQLKAGETAASSRPPWPSCACSATLLKRQDHRPAHRSHRRGRVAHLRHGGLFRQIGIWNQGPEHVRASGRRPADVLQGVEGRTDLCRKGINEAGAMADWMPAATSVLDPRRADDPFYIFYSMFGLQRMDVWAAGDHARGFPDRRHCGTHDAQRRRPATRGRSLHLLAATIPNFALPHLCLRSGGHRQDGLHRMVAQQEDVFYYLTVMNENYEHPAMPEGAAPDILKGMYLFPQRGRLQRPARPVTRLRRDLPRSHRHPAACCCDDWGVDADLWSCPSFNELARDGQRRCAETSCSTHRSPATAARRPPVSPTRADRWSPAPTMYDCMPSRSGPYLPKNRSYTVLGTDGFGRSDTPVTSALTESRPPLDRGFRLACPLPRTVR